MVTVTEEGPSQLGGGRGRRQTCGSRCGPFLGFRCLPDCLCSVDLMTQTPVRSPPSHPQPRRRPQPGPRLGRVLPAGAAVCAVPPLMPLFRAVWENSAQR